MLRFLRKERLQTIQNTGMMKYLAYAFGEILLVVIGILIALQINNWNEQRKLTAKERKLLKEMASNLSEDIMDFDYNIKGTKMRTRANEVMLQVLTEGLPMHDSLLHHFSNYVGSYQLTENTGAYDNLKSIGFDLVRDDELRQKITRLYSNRYEYLDNLEMEMGQPFQMNYLMPRYWENMSTETFWESARPNDLEALAANHEFRELLKFNIFYHGYMLHQYEAMREDAIELRDAIERYTGGA
jgi:hypothetical protein